MMPLYKGFEQAYKNIDQFDRNLLDIISVGTVVATVTDMIPAFAAILSVVWTGIRIYETKTVQSMLGRKPDGKKTDAE